MISGKRITIFDNCADELDYSDAPPEVRKAMKRAWDACRPKNTIGKPVIFGTGGDIQESFEDMFMNPESYAISKKQ